MDGTAELVRLKNIGPESARLLHAAGFRTRADIEAAGAPLVYRVLKDRYPGVSLHLLYALHAALRDRHWLEVTAEEKERLRNEVTQVTRVGPSSPRAGE